MKNRCHAAGACLGAIILAAMLLGRIASAETELDNEFWISTNSNTANLGTLDNPFDGSTQAKFDALMSSMPPYSTIHLLAGTYQTKGDYGWSMKSGQRILGAGEFTTTLQLQISGMQDAVISDDSADGRSDEFAEDVEDLTIDCNYQPGGDNDPYGIILGGTNIVVNHVRVIDGAYPNTTQTSEFFGIMLNGWDNTIENCEVSHFIVANGNNSISAISMNGSGRELNNRVVLTNNVGAAFGVNANGTSGGGILVQGNFVEGAGVGSYNDTWGWTNCQFVDNQYINVRFGIYTFPNSSGHQNILVKDNVVLLTTNAPFGSGAGKWAFDFGGNNTNITVEGNIVDFDGQPNPGELGYDYFMGGGSQGLVIHDNRVNALLDNDVESSYTAYNNYDFSGNLLTNLNQTADLGGIVGTSEGGLGINTSSWPAGYLPYTTGTGIFGSTAITPFGSSLIGQADATSAQSLLGLTIGGTVQPYSAYLSALAGLSPAGGNLIVGNGSSWTTLSTNVFYTLAAEQIAAAAQAATGRDNEFWICPSTNTANLGTVDNPFDGSTQAKFDALMSSMPSYSTIHLLAGTYQTKGDYGWSMKSGQHILGAGEFTTTLQLQISGMQDAGISDDSADGRSDEFAEDVEDLTIDCNYQPGGDNDPYGIILGGTNIVVNHVRVINGAYPNTSQTSEFFGIFLNGQDNTIENCEVSHFYSSPNNSISSICMGGTGKEIDNLVVLTNCLGNDAFGIQSGDGVLVEGNRVEGASVGCYNDTAGWTNNEIVNNVFKNVVIGVNLFPNSTPHRNLLIKDNMVLITTNVSSEGGNRKGGFYLGGNNANITIEGNMVTWDGVPLANDTNDYFVGGGATGLFIDNNRIDPLLDTVQPPNGYPITSPYVAYGNYDFDGNLLTNLNQTADLGGVVGTSEGGLGTNTSSWPAGYLPYTTGTGTFGSTAITPFGSSLIGQADATSAQSLLGLTIGGTVQAYSADLSALAGLSPASGNLIVGNGSGWTTLSTLPLGQLPGQVLTNNESQPVTFASSLNVSGNVTNSTLATTFGSTSGPTTVLLPPLYPSWTNTTPENVVVYLQQFSYPILGITNNGTAIFNSPSGIPFATVMLQPGSYVSVECSGLVSLSWHPL